MRPSLVSRLLAVSFVLSLAGCASTAEPASAYATVGPLAYEFKMVWEAASESFQQEGYPIDQSDRSGAEEGTLFSRVEPGKEREGVQVGRRLAGRVERLGPKKFTLHIAASIFERRAASGPSVGPGDWRYVGKDDELLGRVRVRIDKNIERRYRPSEGG